MFLDSFKLPLEQEQELLEQKAHENGGPFPYIDNPYPCGLFRKIDLSEIHFRDITIFYGGNGSGKSTLLNLIALSLRLNRIAPYNTGEMFDLYAENCEYELSDDDEGFPGQIPCGSRIITSDDIFDYMLTLRTNNSEISESKETSRNAWVRKKYGESIRFRGMENYEELRAQVLARNKSLTRRQFIRKVAGEETQTRSNGETALGYFGEKLKDNTLYCLDEPENSLSPANQLKLLEILSERTRYGGCQLILSTHSPFLLSLDGARIYDLDSAPARVRNWWELENVRIYRSFFEKKRAFFER